MNVNVFARLALGTATAMVGAAVLLAPTAAADVSPVLPYGTNPVVKTQLGQHVSNHDEADTSSGSVDLPF